jgi:hypothetical protein
MGFDFTAESRGEAAKAHIKNRADAAGRCAGGGIGSR